MSEDLGGIEKAPAFKLDVVPAGALPVPLRFSPFHDRTNFVEDLSIDFCDQYVDVSSEEIEAVRPSNEVATLDDFGINFEGLAADARLRQGDSFRHIIRMGGAFDFYRDGHNDHEVEGYAVSTMGLDASLFFHGLEQTRRMNKLMEMQQVAHQNIFADLHITHGNKQATISTYDKVKELFPNFKRRDVKFGVLCGFLHDYGEVKLKRDIPFEQKNNPAYVRREAAEAVAFAIDIHFPHGSPDLVELLDRRAKSDCDPSQSLSAAEAEKVSIYLDPKEITTAIFGTEKLDHGEVDRGDAFAAVERMEYVLSGIRAFEAVEHNFNQIKGDSILTQNLLRLGVSTFFNSLEKLAGYGEKYVAVYDFIAQNSAQIDRYMEIVMDGINVDPDSPRMDKAIFGMDPFENYRKPGTEGDGIDIEAAREKFVKTSKFWQDWKQKSHMARSVWENYFGTDHPLTRNQPDVTFLQQTASKKGEIAETAGQILVYKYLEDMFRVGLDKASQARHESRVLEAAS